ncbi:MAG: two-component response regulator [Methanoregulaceae archaeon PtaU1.Bin222]|nr:MAG: two-component response regulator [Methanoregulaceae archaeon PtaU1.Bin222]
MSSARILIVEDDDVIASLLEWRVKKLGYEVCGKAANGPDALDLVQNEEPSLVLLDIGLPGTLDGIETARRIRKISKASVVFVTGYSQGEIIDRAKTTYPDGFILKPFGDDDLRVGIELALH